MWKEVVQGISGEGRHDMPKMGNWAEVGSARKPNKQKTLPEPLPIPGIFNKIPLI